VRHISERNASILERSQTEQIQKRAASTPCDWCHPTQPRKLRHFTLVLEWKLLQRDAEQHIAELELP
jgi:hypothetical protein